MNWTLASFAFRALIGIAALVGAVIFLLSQEYWVVPILAGAGLQMTSGAALYIAIIRHAKPEAITFLAGLSLIASIVASVALSGTLLAFAAFLALRGNVLWASLAVLASLAYVVFFWRTFRRAGRVS